ncbi:unnamed protein product [Rotaria magnacalcarata]|uniref:Uncharacterized protein n=1 Tax=Rotaria magnacalcarata TaxID=392030 RepID=A0A816TN16_9BILA|nr:unnamed protein product [Rotaria magnacalcarata]CAF1614250.1 unnamed protein product [Rotaria magnacalcarata]CAF1937305.1 unnamed protein product [Rotaria magnacalcarata]CAF1942448.1 unnamed protein product [Rotaria magnacalcarata]CAF2093725.1 unnamed protein product [Rotaria magnacalcarata]
MAFQGSTDNQQTSFPELVGRNAQEAALYITAQGLTPVFVRPDQPVTLDYRTDRVRIVTDPSGNHVIQAPTVG